MTLRAEISEANSRSFNSSKWFEIERGLQELAMQNGHDAEGTWVVVRTAFHGGGVVSRHKTAIRALERCRRESSPSCSCGCVTVVHHSDLDDLGNACESNSPYSAAI